MCVQSAQAHAGGDGEGVGDVGKLVGVSGNAFAVIADVDVDPDGDLAWPGGGGEGVEVGFDVGGVVDEEADGVFAENAGEVSETGD